MSLSLHRLFPILAIVVALAGCSGSVGKVGNPFQAAQPSSGDLVMEMETGEKVILRLQGAPTPLEPFVKMLVERGYYNDHYFYDQTPGSFVLVGKARLSGRPTTAGPYVEKAAEKSHAGTGDVGLVIHTDGTVGPEFILRYGTMFRDKSLQPANVAVGRIISGKDVLEKLQKGDKLSRTYFQR